MTLLDRAIATRGGRDLAAVLGTLALLLGLGLTMSAGYNDNQRLGGLVLCAVALFVLGWISYRGYVAKRTVT